MPRRLNRALGAVLRQSARCAIGTCVLLTASGAYGQFTPGHIFAAEPAQKMCQHNGEYRWDRIWEIDPETGESWLFKELSYEWCGFVFGLAFTPDGSRLLVANRFNSRILSLDSEGNVEVLYDQSDGIRGPGGSNCLAFDAEGGLFVANADNIIRFPPGGGAAELFADKSDGLGVSGGPIAMASDGDVYFGSDLGAFHNFLRFTGLHDETVFDTYQLNEDVITVATDSCGHVFAGLDTGEIFVYDAGQQSSRRLLFHDSSQIVYFSLALSPDEQSLLIVGDGADSFDGVWSLDLSDGSLSLIAEVADAGTLYAGIAVVPVPSVFGDIDHDSAVTLADLKTLVEEYEGAGDKGLMLPCSPADLNHDGAVDLRDVSLFWATPLSN